MTNMTSLSDSIKDANDAIRFNFRVLLQYVEFLISAAQSGRPPTSRKKTNVYAFEAFMGSAMK